MSELLDADYYGVSGMEIENLKILGAGEAMSGPKEAAIQAAVDREATLRAISESVDEIEDDQLRADVRWLLSQVLEQPAAGLPATMPAPVYPIPPATPFPTLTFPFTLSGSGTTFGPLLR